MLDAALTPAPSSAPGQDGVWAHSNAGYVPLGPVARKAAGRPFAEVVTDQIINRIGLEETHYPGPGDRDIRSPHPRGSLPAGDAEGDRIPGELVDITRFDPSLAGAAGGRAVTVAVTNDEAGRNEVLASFDKALCATKQ